FSSVSSEVPCEVSCCTLICSACESDPIWSCTWSRRADSKWEYTRNEVVRLSSIIDRTMSRSRVPMRRPRRGLVTGAPRGRALRDGDSSTEGAARPSARGPCDGPGAPGRGRWVTLVNEEGAEQDLVVRRAIAERERYGAAQAAAAFRPEGLQADCEARIRRGALEPLALIGPLDHERDAGGGGQDDARAGEQRVFRVGERGIRAAVEADAGVGRQRDRVEVGAVGAEQLEIAPARAQPFVLVRRGKLEESAQSEAAVAGPREPVL